MAGQISIPAAILGLQGAVNVGFGTLGLVKPGFLTGKLTEDFGGVIPTEIAYTLSLQLVGLGIFTLLAASRPSLHRRAMIARIGVHLLAGYFFWNVGAGTGVNSVAGREIVFAVLNLVAMPFATKTENR